MIRAAALALLAALATPACTDVVDLHVPDPVADAGRDAGPDAGPDSELASIDAMSLDDAALDGAGLDAP